MLNHLKSRTIPLLAVLDAAALVNRRFFDDMRVSSCDEGHRTQACGIGDLCTLSCDGGDCDQICESLECTFDCEHDCDDPY